MSKEIIIVTISLGNDGAERMVIRLLLFKRVLIGMVQNILCLKV